MGLFAVLGLLLVVVGTAHDLITFPETRAAHTAEVSHWLASDYGIDLDATKIRSLISGTSYDVVYDGKPTTISLVESPGNLLSVVSSTQTTLEPRR